MQACPADRGVQRFPEPGNPQGSAKTRREPAAATRAAEEAWAPSITHHSLRQVNHKNPQNEADPILKIFDKKMVG